MIGKLKQINFSLKMWCYSGMLGMKIKASMESLKNYGRDLIILLHTKDKMHSCSKRWMEKIV